MTGALSDVSRWPVAEGYFPKTALRFGKLLRDVAAAVGLLRISAFPTTGSVVPRRAGCACGAGPRGPRAPGLEHQADGAPGWQNARDPRRQGAMGLPMERGPDRATHRPRAS